MQLITNQESLLQFVKEQHGEQIRKYTNEPYWHHVVSVAEIVAPYLPDTFCVEVALCHDLFEDTSCNFSKLYNALVSFGYSRNDSYDICTWVTQLTDVYTAEAHSYMNRTKRKVAEAKRLADVSPLAQTVKYADLIDNTSSIVKYDKGFAVKYLAEKDYMLQLMVKGKATLRQRCLDVLKDAYKELDLQNVY